MQQQISKISINSMIHNEQKKIPICRNNKVHTSRSHAYQQKETDHKLKMLKCAQQQSLTYHFQLEEGMWLSMQNRQQETFGNEVLPCVHLPHSSVPLKQIFPIIQQSRFSHKTKQISIQGVKHHNNLIPSFTLKHVSLKQISAQTPLIIPITKICAYNIFTYPRTMHLT